MKKLVLFLLFLTFTNLVFANDFNKFIGNWTNSGKLELIIKAEGDFVTLEMPESPVFKAEFQNVRIENGKLKFDELVSLKNGNLNTLNNHSVIWEDENGKMWWGDSTNNVPPVEIIKVKE